jgi:hypothetical protein
MRTPKQSAPVLVLRCNIEKDHGYGHVRFHPLIQKPDGKIEGCGFDGKFGELFVDGLLISDQIDDRSGRMDGTRDYGWSCEFAKYRIDLRDAKNIVKTLTMIDKKTESIRETFGYPKSYGEYVMRIAVALGVQKFLFASTRYPSEEQELTGGSAIDRINREVEILSRKLRGEPTIEEERAQKDREEAERNQAAA